MDQVSREQLAGYLLDALSDTETARVEQALRGSEPLRKQLRQLMDEGDRGEHSIGAIWRRQRLTCPSRDFLGSYLLGVLEKGERDYIRFHLETIGCAFCGANVADLKAKQKEPEVKKRRKRYFESSTGYLKGPEKK